MLPQHRPSPDDPTTALVQDHQAGLWRYLRYLGCRHDEAEDLAQDVFLTALAARADERLGDLDKPAMAAWLRRTAHNILRSTRRRLQRRLAVDLEAAEALFERMVAPGGNDGSAFLDALEACLAELPDRARAAIEARYLDPGDGSSRRDLAARFGLRAEGVKSLLRRGRELLRACVERKTASTPPTPEPSR